MTRRTRRVLIGGALVVVAVGGAVVGFTLWSYSRAVVDTVDELRFDTPLRIPELDTGRLDPDGTRRFSLDLRAGENELVPGHVTSTWGANGTHLGPTLRAARGERVRVDVTNHLDEATTLHWHGMALPAVADGGPHSPIPPGSTWSPTWTIDQPAATLWYHPHPHGHTTDHVLRGLVGLFVIDDPGDVPADVPADDPANAGDADDPGGPTGMLSRYGVDDVPLVIQDVRLRPDGSIDTSTPTFGSVGPLGDRLLVNGTHAPHFDVTTTAVRLRVLNASPARIFDLGLADERELSLVATDGGALDPPHRTRRVLLSPGERAEIVVEIQPGETVMLRSFPPDIGVDGFQARFSGLHDRFDVLELRAAPELETVSAPPAGPAPSGSPDDEPDPADATRTRAITLQGSTRIDGRSMDMDRIDHVVAAGSTEIWDLRNESGGIHNLHVHDVQFRVLEYDGAPPPPHLRGPKDTVLLPPGVSARVVMRFSDHPDPRTPYMIHCHILRHEDDGMMAQFTVVEPDRVDDAPRRLSGGHRHGW